MTTIQTLTLQQLATFFALAYVAEGPKDSPVANVDIFDAFFDLRDDPAGPDVLPHIEHLVQQGLLTFVPEAEGYIINTDAAEHDLFAMLFIVPTYKVHGDTAIDPTNSDRDTAIRLFFDTAFPRAA